MKTRAWRVVAVMAAAVVVVGGLIVGAPRSALAQAFAGVYVGSSYAHDRDIEEKLTIEGIEFFDGTLEDVEADTSVIVGGKAGYFFPGILQGKLGVELDVYHYRPEMDRQTVRRRGSLLGAPFDEDDEIERMLLEVTAVTLNALLRLPFLVGSDFPRGRLHPYFGIGGGLFVANAEVDIALDERIEADDCDLKPGVQALAGLMFFLTQNIALFAEYKFTHTAEFDLRFRGSGTVAGIPVTANERREVGLTSHHWYAGLAFHW
ncbi:MAG TPA: outer membrane beta-barrel protein [Candidatus Binatia bacterium]|nr:outer membrane beta-barrel protein [Candidatus Binatia bacterium]